jgi:GDSL-like Lipase/Acylhydrolase family
MLVGDSITQGSMGDYTWRYRLWQHLRASRVPVRFVGPRHDLWDDTRTSTLRFVFSDQYADPAFGADSAANAHDALVGIHASAVAPGIGAVVREYRPDYLIVLLGINDLATGAEPAQVAGSMRRLVLNARAAAPAVRFDLVQALPAAPVAAAKVAAYGALLDQLGARLSTRRSPIAVTAAPAGYSASATACADTWDGTHPNAPGELKIASAVAGTLHSAFGLGAAYPRPLPQVPAGPQPPPLLTAQAAAGAVRLGWTASPGATGYWVWRHAPGQQWSRLPLPLNAFTRSFTDGGWPPALRTGNAYQYRIEAIKGFCGSSSNTVTVIPDG